MAPGDVDDAPGSKRVVVDQRVVGVRRHEARRVVIRQAGDAERRRDLVLVDRHVRRRAAAGDRVLGLRVQVGEQVVVAVVEIQMGIDGVRGRGQAGGRPGGGRPRFERLVLAGQAVGKPARRVADPARQRSNCRARRANSSGCKARRTRSRCRHSRRRPPPPSVGGIVHDLVGHQRRDVGDAVGRARIGRAGKGAEVGRFQQGEIGAAGRGKERFPGDGRSGRRRRTGHRVGEGGRPGGGIHVDVGDGEIAVVLALGGPADVNLLAVLEGVARVVQRDRGRRAVERDAGDRVVAPPSSLVYRP